MRSRLVVSLTLLLALSALPLAGSEDSYTKNVAVVLYNGVEVLDFAGPAEVFAVAAGYGAADGQAAFNVYTVARTKDPIVSQGFIDVIPDYSIEDSPAPDILVLPGGSSRAVTDDPEFMAWIETMTERDRMMVLTVCTGAFIAGRGGLLEGIESTTWYDAVPRLAAAFPATTVHPGRRFVDSGNIITTAGVSAGIDGSLHLVARTLGRYVADRTAEYMEYRWTPEAVHSSRYTQLNPQLDARGRAIQRGEIDLREGSADHALATFRTLVENDPHDTIALLGLASSLHLLERYEEAIAANQRAADSGSEQASAYFNMACGYAMMGRHDEAIEAVEKAVAAGLRARWYFENETDLESIRNDPRFRALVEAL